MKREKTSWKLFWIACDIAIVLSIILFYFGSSVYAKEGEDFCILWVSCDGDDSLNATWNDSLAISILRPNDTNFSGYKHREEGKVIRGQIYHENMFETVEKVVAVSEEEYAGIIGGISGEGSFDKIYNKYTNVFDQGYSTKIDSSSGGDYIQNIGELISNSYSGDCDDYAMWLYLIAKEKGLDVRYAVGFNPGSGHAWVQIKVDGEWWDYDSTSNSKGVDVVSQRYVETHYYEEDSR